MAENKKKSKCVVFIEGNEGIIYSRFITCFSVIPQRHNRQHETVIIHTFLFHKLIAIPYRSEKRQ